MASPDQGRPLPKFGEWDVKNPASAERFTVIFNRARDEKRTKAGSGSAMLPRRNDNDYKQNEKCRKPPKSKWLCCA